MDVLLVGAGRMGCAHLQGLAHSDRFKRVLLVEPFAQAREAAQKAWDATEQAAGKELSFVEWDEIAKGRCAAAVIATSAPGRLDIVRACAARGIPNVLAEKILFQSVADYREAMRISQDANMKIHAHLPYRTVQLFQTLRDRLAGQPFEMTVTVGDRGLGCNAVHYLDLCQFITDGEVTSIDATIDLPVRDNPRGDELVEFSGRVDSRFATGAQIEIIYEQGHMTLPVIELRQHNSAAGFTHLRVEMDGAVVQSDAPDLVEIGFSIPYASKVAHQLVADIMDGTSLLPDLAQGFELNRLLLDRFNQELTGNATDDMVCPVT